MKKHSKYLAIRAFYKLLTSFLLMVFVSPDGYTNSGTQLKRSKSNITKGWYYIERNDKRIDDILTVAATEKLLIDLPHTWNAYDAVDPVPGYRRDASWYEKSLEVHAEKGVEYFLYFEGANMETEVYVNGKFAGRHIGGYTGFEIQLTDFLNQGRNTFNIRVDNSINPDLIPSQKSDFILYGGITRDVWLLTTPEIFIQRSLIQSPIVNDTLASTEVNTWIETKQTSINNYYLTISILDHTKRKLVSERQKVKSFNEYTTVTLPVLKNPHLWTTDDPYLYSCLIELYDGKKVTDTLVEKIGYRWVEFREKGAFYLNGKNLLLRGTHRHEEHAGYGAAMPDSLHERDMRSIKEMGANFIRLAHYPQDPVVYKMCDQLGLLVWDELPWCRGGIGGRVWKENTKRIFQEMIQQNFNRPSVILWSLGNEINWLPDVEGGDNDDSIKSFLKELNSMAHKLDPYRPTCLRKYYPAANMVDVFSPSIWSGWYSGSYSNYENALTDSKKKYKRFFHAEYGGDSHIGRHRENFSYRDSLYGQAGWEEKAVQTSEKNMAQYGDWSETYIVDLFDWHLKVSEQQKDFTGNAQWVFKDFATPLRPENPIPYMNQKGLMDRAGNPKDAYYVYKSYWTSNPAFCYIESHTWKTRYGKGKPESLQVCVFSNCDQVQLMINGIDLERKSKDLQKFPASGFTWMVSFKEGKNKLLATGYKNGEPVTADSLEIEYSYLPNGPAERIELNHSLLPDGHYLIEARVLDQNNKLCIDYTENIYFSHTGSGKMLISQGTNRGSQIIEAANGRAFIEFIPSGKGQAIIEVRNQDFKGAYLQLDF